jgi:hypothetical protein
LPLTRRFELWIERKAGVRRRETNRTGRAAHAQMGCRSGGFSWAVDLLVFFLMRSKFVPRKVFYFGSGTYIYERRPVISTINEI